MLGLNNLKLWPSDYFFPPNGFDNYPRLQAVEENGEKLSYHSWATTISRSWALVFNLVTILALLLWPFIVKTKEKKHALVIVSLLTATVFFLSYAVNGGEQERMRYTLNVGLFISFIVIIRAGGYRVKNYLQSKNKQAASLGNKSSGQ